MRGEERRGEERRGGGGCANAKRERVDVVQSIKKMISCTPPEKKKKKTLVLWILIDAGKLANGSAYNVSIST